ncbi:MAG TPA: hypothetical protein VFV55_08750 [Usitatibacteraceae bacterium]|nr:hypothetical protein [Usitatibacteraceae bacterium]
MNPDPDEIDWSLTTWEGSRRAQIRLWMSFTVRERLEMIEGMAELAKHLRECGEREIGRGAVASEPRPRDLK